MDEYRTDVGHEVETDRQTEVSKVLNKLQQVSEILSKNISILEDRLASVTNGGGLKEAGLASNQKTVEFTTDLAQRINNSVELLSSASDRVNRLRNRIEL